MVWYGMISNAMVYYCTLWQGGVGSVGEKLARTVDTPRRKLSRSPGGIFITWERGGKVGGGEQNSILFYEGKILFIRYDLFNSDFDIEKR